MESAPVIEYATPSLAASRRSMPRMQELGLVVVIALLGAVLSAYGYYEAEPGQENTFLNPGNIVELVATPASW